EVQNETSPPHILASGRGRGRAADRVALRLGASLSVTTGAVDRRISAGRLGRHHRAPDRSMAVGTARPASRHREPAGRRPPYPDRDRAEIPPPPVYPPPRPP